VTSAPARERVVRAFAERFGRAPAWRVRAPGRVNLLGEHTDYNDGFVLPMALEHALWIACAPRNDRQVRLYSLDYEEERSFDLDRLAHAEGWSEYAKAVAFVLTVDGVPLRGMDAVLAGEIPIGAGLSSSAAFTVGSARALVAICGAAWDPVEAALRAQRAENEWIGVQCGIMDQLIVAGARADHALLIDCRNLATWAVPLPDHVAVAVLDTGTRRNLAESSYNDCRDRCETAARVLGVASLRDVSPALLEARLADLPEAARRAARHVVGENERTLAAAQALERGDAMSFGKLMNAGHASLRDDYEVSGPALDAIVTAARQAPGCFGARMTGAGFAGCAVALLAAAQTDAFIASVTRDYAAATGREGKVYACQPAEAASAEPLT